MHTPVNFHIDNSRVMGDGLEAELWRRLRDHSVAGVCHQGSPEHQRSHVQRSYVANTKFIQLMIY